MLSEHANHTWVDRGRCVYCDNCNIRLYQGRLPSTPEYKADMIKFLDTAINQAKHQDEGEHGHAP
jgi:hypothetical protein